MRVFGLIRKTASSGDYLSHSLSPEISQALLSTSSASSHLKSLLQMTPRNTGQYYSQLTMVLLHAGSLMGKL